jgi:hypothetical protein
VTGFVFPPGGVSIAVVLPDDGVKASERAPTPTALAGTGAAMTMIPPIPVVAAVPEGEV